MTREQFIEKNHRAVARAGAENHYMDCYKKVRDALGLTRSTKSRDTGIVASEFNRMRKEKKDGQSE